MISPAQISKHLTGSLYQSKGTLLTSGTFDQRKLIFRPPGHEHRASPLVLLVGCCVRDQGDQGKPGEPGHRPPKHRQRCCAYSSTLSF